MREKVTERLEVNEETWAWVNMLDQGEPGGVRGRLDNLRGFGHLFLGYARYITSNHCDELPVIASLHKQLLDDLENDLRRIVATNIRRHNWVLRDGQLCATSDEEEET